MPGAHSADWRRAFWGQGLTLPTPSCPSSHPRNLAHSLNADSSPLTASHPGDAGPGSAMVLCVWAKLWFPFQPASQKSVSVSSAPATTTPPTPTRHIQAQPNPRVPKAHRFLDVSPPTPPNLQPSSQDPWWDSQEPEGPTCTTLPLLSQAELPANGCSAYSLQLSQAVGHRAPKSSAWARSRSPLSPTLPSFQSLFPPAQFQQSPQYPHPYQVGQRLEQDAERGLLGGDRLTLQVLTGRDQGAKEEKSQGPSQPLCLHAVGPAHQPGQADSWEGKG